MGQKVLVMVDTGSDMFSPTLRFPSLTESGVAAADFKDHFFSWPAGHGREWWP
jgi:hypothetical protein